MSSLPRTPGVYIIICIPTAKLYVGSTINICKRWSDHRCRLRGNRHENPYLQYAWNKHGESAFICIVLEEVSPDTLEQREQFWLDFLSPFDDRGFNASQYAQTASDETRARMSKSRKGRKFTEQHRANMSAAMRKHERTPEHRANLSKALKGRKIDPMWRANMKAASARKKWYLLTSPDGVEIKVYGLSDFCRDNNLTYVTMLNVARGKHRHHKGWKCRKVDE
jgi:group I intron endonuclease